MCMKIVDQLGFIRNLPLGRKYKALFQNVCFTTTGRTRTYQLAVFQKGATRRRRLWSRNILSTTISRRVHGGLA